MFKALVMKNRSYRGYDASYQVSKEQLMEMVDCARLCPSSVNVQPLKYYLAYDLDIVEKIQSLTGWARGLPDLNLPFPGYEPTAFIVICQDLSISDAIPRYQKDVGIVAQTMLLQACFMDLGGCMIGNFNPNLVKEKLELSNHFMPVLIVAIGKPNETILLEDCNKEDSINYYRDDLGNHHVPKRKLEDIIIE